MLAERSAAHLYDTVLNGPFVFTFFKAFSACKYSVKEYCLLFVLVLFLDLNGKSLK